MNAFQATPKGVKKGSLEGDRFNCQFVPGPAQRDAGTLQHGVWTIKQQASLDYSEPFYLVISSNRGWLKEDEAVQRYATVVSLEHRTREIELYEALRARTRIAQRARLRPRQ
jgi:hypothetical protein